MAIRGYDLEIGGDATQVSTLVRAFKQLDIQASPDNSDNVYLCDADGNYWGALLPGKSWGAKAHGGDQSAEEVGDDFYLSGTQGEFVHLVWVD
jgi:hypothetical protein